jgi:hypothetical protein
VREIPKNMLKNVENDRAIRDDFESSTFSNQYIKRIDWIYEVYLNYYCGIKTTMHIGFALGLGFAHELLMRLKSDLREPKVC